jgi:hypothetical protein
MAQDNAPTQHAYITLHPTQRPRCATQPRLVVVDAVDATPLHLNIYSNYYTKLVEINNVKNKNISIDNIPWHNLI